MPELSQGIPVHAKGTAETRCKAKEVCVGSQLGREQRLGA